MSDKKPEKPKIAAIITQNAPEVLPETSYFEPNPGEYHLIGLSVGGDEVPGTDFSIGERTFNRSFLSLTQGNSPKFKVKKNPNQ